MRMLAILLALAALALVWLSLGTDPGTRDVGGPGAERPTAGSAASAPALAEAERDAAPSSRAAAESGSAERTDAASPDVDETRIVELAVTALAHVDGGLRALGGVTFEVGLGTGKPWEPALASALTGPDGTRTLQVEIAERDARERLFVRPVEPGWTSNPVLCTVPPPGTVRQVLVRLERGCTLVGRVLDPRGEPARGARVLVRTEPQPRGILSSGWFARADDEGRFRLHAPAEGTGFLRANLTNVGTALLQPVDFAALCGEELLLQLAGSGVLAGRAVDPEGRPLEDLLLEVRNVTVETHGAADELTDRGRGLVAAQVRTGPGGAFRFEGLEPGRYAFWQPAALGGFGEVPREPVATDAEELELVCPLRRFELTVVSAVDGRTIETGRWQGAPDVKPRTLFEWTATPDVPASWQQRIPDAERGAVSVFFVEAGWTVRFAALALGRRSDVSMVVIGPADWLVERTVELPAGGAPGTLELAIESRSELPPEALDVAVLVPGGPRLFDLERVLDPASRRYEEPLALPAGEYEVLVDARLVRARGGPRVHGHASARVRIESGVTHRTRLFLDEGAWYTLTVEALEPPAPVEETLPGWTFRATDPLYAHDGAGRPRELRDADGDVDLVEPGTTQRIWVPAPPGVGELRFAYDGYAPQSVPLSHATGEERALTVRLTRD